MRVRKTPVLAVSLVAVGSFALVAFSAPPGALPTTASRVAEKPVVKSYPVVDAKGRKIGSAKWRVTKAGGNCCEVLVTATRTGRLVEFGGTYPLYSDDQGKTWQEIAPLSPSTSRLPNPGPRKLGGGEGTLVQSPDGDILGVGWDPYSGDRLQSFMYHAKDKKWYYQEAPLHEPFYDRQWVAVAKGPFTINGSKVPWVSLVISNFNRKTVLMSTDGLNYFTPTQRDLAAVANPPVSKFLPTTPDPDLDYMQEQSQTKLYTLAKGLLSFDETATDCAVQTLTTEGSWACFTMPNEVKLTGPLLTDSRGWVHEVKAEGGTEIVYKMTRNGGRTWTKKTFVLPGEPTIAGPGTGATYDVKVNGKLGMAVVATHARIEDEDVPVAERPYQDMVMVFDVKTTTPKLKKIYYVGDGDLKSTVGLDPMSLITGQSDRVDFTSVAILPNGKIAVSFADKKYSDPALAILM